MRLTRGLQSPSIQYGTRFDQSWTPPTSKIRQQSARRFASGRRAYLFYRRLVDRFRDLNGNYIHIRSSTCIQLCCLPRRRLIEELLVLSREPRDVFSNQFLFLSAGIHIEFHSFVFLGHVLFLLLQHFRRTRIKKNLHTSRHSKIQHVVNSIP